MSRRVGTLFTSSIFFFFCVASFYGAFPTRSQATEVVVTFGDSITAGWPYMQQDGNGCYNCGGYQYYLQYFYNVLGQDKIVYNYGNPGEYVEEGMARIDSVMAANYPVDYVLLMEGANNLTFFADPGYVAYLLYWVAVRVSQWGAIPVLATITPDNRHGVDWKNVGVANAYIKYYVQSNPWICLSDQHAAIAPYWGYGYDYDGLHPNWYGYWVMGATWYWDVETLNYCNY